jgi:hypothetical protein
LHPYLLSCFSGWAAGSHHLGLPRFLGVAAGDVYVAGVAGRIEYRTLPNLWTGLQFDTAFGTAFSRTRRRSTCPSTGGQARSASQLEIPMAEYPVVLHQAPPGTVVVSLMSLIRPAWRAKSLIQRVERLLAVDPSSACQRLLNAAFHDLKEKVIVAGLDIAKQAADQAKLPSVNKTEDVEAYSSDKLLDLAYEMGILSRPEWRRIKRCYEIRRDLEHEDDEYEAGVEDAVYIFKTCIEVVLSKDPVQLLRVTDVKEVVEQPQPFFPSEELLDGYAKAPDPRQLEILKFLAAYALKEDNADLVRQNAFKMLKYLQRATRNPAKLDLAKHLQERVGKQALTLGLAKVANAAGVLPYLKESKRRDFFQGYCYCLNQIGYTWRNHLSHRQPLEELEDVGGFRHCPDGDVLKELLRWMTLCYIGTQGGRTSYGNIRPVFNGDIAAPIIERLVARGGERVLRVLKDLREDATVRQQMAWCKDVAARYELLLDVAGDK